MPLNPWITNSFLDTCAFDPKYAPEEEAANEIFRLHRESGLGIMLAHSNQKEIEHPNTPKWVKSEAAGQIYTVEVQRTANEDAIKQRILEIITGTGRPVNMRHDAEHIYEAQKYGSYFVTTDSRLLNKARKLDGFCGVNVLLPSQFLEIVAQNKRPE